jgi:ribulose-5-phosphate 4-epimerase/fuculose-1-phosphate aldolase
VNHIFCIMSLSAVVQTGLPLLRWNRIVIWNEALVKNQDKGLVSAVTAFVSGHGPVAVEGPAKQAQPAT